MPHNPQARFSVRKLLSFAVVYSAFQAGIGADNARAKFVSEHVRPKVDERVLDIGCGTGEIFGFLQKQSYIGFDPEVAYIERARAAFGTIPEFLVGSVSAPPDLGGGFDLVISIGVLHHLDDSAARTLVDLAREQLRSGGRFITLDPVLVTNQHPVARALAKRDRGDFVRSPDEYRALARGRFESVQITEHHDYLRVPYSHLAMECQ